MKITKEILSNGKKVIQIKWSGRARNLPQWAVYLKNSCYLELAKILKCGVFVSYENRERASILHHKLWSPAHKQKKETETYNEINDISIGLIA